MQTMRFLVAASLMTLGSSPAAQIQPGTPFFGPIQQSFMESSPGTGVDSGGDLVVTYTLSGPVVAGQVRLFEGGIEPRTLSDIVFFVPATDSTGNLFYRCADDNFQTPTINITGKHGCEPFTTGVSYFSDPIDPNDSRLLPMVGTPVDLDEPLMGQSNDALDFVTYSPPTDINGNAPATDPNGNPTTVYKIFSDSDIAIPEPATPILVLAGLSLLGLVRFRAGGSFNFKTERPL